MDRTKLTYTPSKTKQYLHCPYFLKLSNIVKIPIDEPHILGIRRTQIFKEYVTERVSIRKGVELIRAKKLLELIVKPGLFLFQKKLDTVIASNGDSDLVVQMFKSDLIETKHNGNNIDVNVKSIKNTDTPKEKHFLQAYVYKAALEKALQGASIKAINVTPSVIHWNHNYYPLRDNIDLDLDDFRQHLLGDNFFTEISLSEDEEYLSNKLRWISSLSPQENKDKCETCEGQFCCDVYHDIDFYDRYKWFDKFNNLKREEVKEERSRFSGISFTSTASKKQTRIIKGDGFIMINY